MIFQKHLKAVSFWENCIHIIGKDILKFHAIYWPAMLMVQKFLFQKKYLRMDGGQMKVKISKSIGNVIDPNVMIEKYGLDQFKYFLLREVTLVKMELF